MHCRWYPSMPCSGGPCSQGGLNAWGCLVLGGSAPRGSAPGGCLVETPRMRLWAVRILQECYILFLLFSPHSFNNFKDIGIRIVSRFHFILSMMLVPIDFPRWLDCLPCGEERWCKLDITKLFEGNFAVRSWLTRKIKIFLRIRVVIDKPNENSCFPQLFLLISLVTIVAIWVRMTLSAE